MKCLHEVVHITLWSHNSLLLPCLFWCQWTQRRSYPLLIILLNSVYISVKLNIRLWGLVRFRLTWMCNLQPLGNTVLKATWTNIGVIMHFTSPATKSDASHQAVFTVTTQEFFVYFCFQSLKVLCHSLACRGQPCIMSALTAMQLYMIQSLDERELKPPRAIY